MNNSHHQLQATVAQCLLAELNGLNEKHAAKLQKTIASAAKKLVRKYAKLEAKEQKGHKKAKSVAAEAAPIKAVLRATKAAPQPAVAKRPAPVARRTQKKAAPIKVAVEA